MAPRGVTGLVPMGAVYGEFITSASGSGKVARRHTPYRGGARRRQHNRRREAGGRVQERAPAGAAYNREQQIPWESTSLELDFYFVPPAPPPSPAAHLLAAADETGNAALFDLPIERFPGLIRSRRCQGRARQAASPREQ